jgi:PPIC-type PPIASE domain/SurA N-terminal domain
MNRLNDDACGDRSPGSSLPASSRRSFIFMGCGCLLGLLMAGYSLFTARGTSTLIVPPEDVALVNQQPISRSDYLQQLQTLYGVDLQHATAQQRRKVLDDMIREELFVQRGKELDVAATDPDVRAALVNAVELEIAADAITTRPSEAALRAYHSAHLARYSSEGIMALRDFVVASSEPSSAKALAQALRSSTPMPALLARWRAADSGKVSSEEFYFAAKIHLGDALFEAARDLPDGGVSAPIPRPDGIHVLYMVKNTRPLPIDFGEARDQVLTDYRKDSIERLRTADESFLRRRANVLIADDLH